MNGEDIQLLFLADGGQPADVIAQALAAFLGAARQSLDIAIYDCGLTGSAAETVGGALVSCASRGVQIRVAYYAGPHESPAVPPPSGSSASFLQGLGLPTRPVHGFHALMHDKYVVRDAGGAASVWTGSMNWTNDSWSREENIVVQLPSTSIATLYQADFLELWNTGAVESTGGREGSASLSYGGQPVPARVWFSPARGQEMSHAVAEAVAGASRRLVFATPVLTVGSVLGAVRDVVSSGRVPVSGVYDATQMDEVDQQWASDSDAGWKIDAFSGIKQGARTAGKRSAPYGPGSVHDYMHAKIVVVDDTVFTGSYNFSHSGENNAENLLRFDSSLMADGCVDYIEGLIARYSGSGA